MNAGKILIIYYSLTDQTRRVAELLAEKTNATLFRIETVRSYPTQQPAVYDEPKKELESGALPELRQLPSKIAEYDLILIGGPVWWYTVSTPVMQLLSEINLQGKTVAAFCTHMGGPGRYFEHFREQAEAKSVLDGIEIFKASRSRMPEIDAALNQWLKQLFQA